MTRRFITTLAIVVFGIATLIVAVSSVGAQSNQTEFGTPSEVTSPPSSEAQLFSTTCAIQPERQRSKASRPRWRSQPIPLGAITLARFRQLPPPVSPAPKVDTKPEPLSATVPSNDRPTLTPNPFTPREEIALIDITNFGDRYLRDINGNPAILEPIVVLHETVGSASSAINFFRNAHANDADQASYHSLIKLDGTVVYLVPPDKRAFGAGNSVFQGANGPELVRTHPKFPGSVNNFAYHISLETPSDGRGNSSRHSGYTAAQYQSLAWLVSKTGVSDQRITTHRAVDRSRSRIDPRSFDTDRFLTLLNTFPRTTEIPIRCTVPDGEGREKS